MPSKLKPRQVYLTDEELAAIEQAEVGSFSAYVRALIRADLEARLNITIEGEAPQWGGRRNEAIIAAAAAALKRNDE